MLIHGSSELGSQVLWLLLPKFVLELDSTDPVAKLDKTNIFSVYTNSLHTRWEVIIKHWLTEFSHKNHVCMKLF